MGDRQALCIPGAYPRLGRPRGWYSKRQRLQVATKQAACVAAASGSKHRLQDILPTRACTEAHQPGLLAGCGTPCSGAPATQVRDLLCDPAAVNAAEWSERGLAGSVCPHLMHGLKALNDNGETVSASSGWQICTGHGMQP